MRERRAQSVSPVTIGSLFSGIGGLELGLEQAGFGPTLFQCEIDRGCRAVLAHHWPYATRFDDVTKANSYPYVDLLCGGFPCQDVSDASHGRGGGIHGAQSGLWRAFAKVIETIQPAIVVVENVGGAAAKKWLPTVRRDMHMLGYRTRALRIDARDVGAPHARARIFVVGYADANSKSTRAFYAKMARLPPSSGLGGHWRQPFAGAVRVADGLPSGMDALHALGNAVMPQQAWLVGQVIRRDLEKRIRQ